MGFDKKKTKILCTVFCASFCICVVLHVKALIYLSKTFVFNPLTNVQNNSLSEKSTTDGVPKKLHFIHFNITGKPMDNITKNIIQSCVNFHPDYSWVLWNESAVTHLIKTKHSHLYTLYMEQPYWVTKVDIAKYVILYEEGGVYIDTDMKCLCSLEPLVQNIKENVVVYETQAYKISTEFLAAQKHTYFYDLAIKNLHLSDQWYMSRHFKIMLTAGPPYLLGIYLNYPFKRNVKIIQGQPKCLLKVGGFTWMKIDSLIFHKIQHVIDFILSNLFLFFTAIILLIVVMYKSWKTLCYYQRQVKNKHYFGLKKSICSSEIT